MVLGCLAPLIPIFVFVFSLCFSILEISEFLSSAVSSLLLSLSETLPVSVSVWSEAFLLILSSNFCFDYFFLLLHVVYLFH